MYNTVFRTRRNSYNGPYYGFVADNVNQDSLECAYNLIVAPETDYPFDAHRGYIMAIISKEPGHQIMVGNKVFKCWNKNIVQDTIDFVPGAAAALLGNPPAANYSVITVDFAGVISCLATTHRHM